MTTIYSTEKVTFIDLFQKLGYQRISKLVMLDMNRRHDIHMHILHISTILEGLISSKELKMRPHSLEYHVILQDKNKCMHIKCVSNLD